MKTICIKTNNPKILNYLLNNIKQIDLNDIYFSSHKFKIYDNIFIHYKGNDAKLFFSTIANILTFSVLDIYEASITKNILKNEYFYFENKEKQLILDKIHSINLESIENFEEKENTLHESFYNFFLASTKSRTTLYLKGFITFRLKKYITILEKIVDDAVKQYLIEKEYNEFVSLLKIYIKSEESKIDLVHLIYTPESKQIKPILLDKNKNNIKIDINLLNAKYLSDISFSSSDMILNTLLNLLPKKIYIHLLSDNYKDEFISTLELIFDNRVTICKDCDICRFFFSKYNNINLL